MAIRNIIFDLGGVLLNIDFDLTRKAFETLGYSEMSKLFGLGKAAGFVEDYELGKIDDETFIREVKATSSADASDEAVIAAWNALLLDFPQPRVHILQRLSAKFNLYLFSNTNPLHVRHFEPAFEEKYGYELSSLFRKIYYSHEIGHRKPYAASYEYILKDAGIAAEETLFVDDAENNIEGAAAAGLHTLHIDKTNDIVKVEWSQYE